MRLINTITFKLEEFSDDSIPLYAILSHTWGKDSEELSFRDVENGEIDKPGVGSTKFRGCCQKAADDGLGYAWIDTCCIDKTNLVELSEAINSMFRWYSCASVCYAYLSDVPCDDNPRKPESKFRTSRWFQRGWTLQELLAPKDLRFYNSEWKCIGTKGTISNLIKNITCVPQPFLLGITELHVASVAQRMSWAAQRETKRPEDLAYCLLGIFGIAMPMIYGEGGEQAFFRLQEQIMKTTRDDSILAWGLSIEANESSMSIRDQVIGGEILAAGPSYFKNSGQIVVREHTPNPLHSIDVFGGSLRIYLPLVITSLGETVGLLSCGPALTPNQVVGIPLAKATSGASNEYVRPRGCPSMLRPTAASSVSPELIHIKKDGQKDVKINQQHWLYEEDVFARVDLMLVDVEPPSCWDKQRNLISSTSEAAAAGRILLRFRHSEARSQDFIMVLEVKQPGSNTEPQFYIAICCRDTPLLELAEKYQHESSKASRETRASNGVLHLLIALELLEGSLQFINLEAMAFPSDKTVDATAELQKSDIILEYTQLLREKRQISAEVEELNARSSNHPDRLQLSREQKETIEDQMIELEVRSRVSVIEEKGNAGQMHHIVKEKRDDIHKRLEHAQQRLDRLQHIYNCEEGRTLFREAVDNGHAKVAKMFLTKTARATTINDNGWTSLTAAEEDADMLWQLLVANRVEPDHKDGKLGRTALSWASLGGHGAVVQLLLETGKLDVNSRDDYGRTPLHWATKGGHEGVVKLLLDTGKSDVNSRDDDGRTPLHWATDGGHEKVIKLLLRTDKLDVNSRDNNGWASIHLASSMNYENIVQLLLDTGVDSDCVRTLYGHTDWVSSVAFSHDSKLIASGSYDSMMIWKTATDQLYQTIIPPKKRIFAVTFSHHPHYILLGSENWDVETWDTETGQCLRTLQGHKSIVRSVAVSHDSRLLVSGSEDNTIRIWDSTTGKCQQTLQGHENYVFSVAFSHDSKFVVSGSEDNTIKIWDNATGQCQQTLHGHRHGIRSVVVSHDSKLIVSGSYDKTIKIWDSITGECQQTLQGHESSVSSVALSHDSKLIVSGSYDKTIKIWDSTTGECQQTLRGHEDWICSVAFSHDSKLIVSGSRDHTVRIWASGR